MAVWTTEDVMDIVQLNRVRLMWCILGSSFARCVILEIMTSVSLQILIYTVTGSTWLRSWHNKCLINVAVCVAVG